MDPAQIVDSVTGGGTAGFIILAGLLALHYWTKSRNGHPLTKESVMAIAKEVGDANREAMRESIGKIHAHLERHEKEEMRLFQKVDASLSATATALHKLCLTMDRVNERTLEIRIAQKLRRGEPLEE